MGRIEATILRAAHSRPMVLCGVLAPSQRADLRKWMTDIDGSRWERGDGSTHAWRECLLARTELDAVLPLIPFVAKLTEEADRMVAWVNCFSPGEWIGEHRDADGDIQLVVPIEMPSAGQGGDLWVDKASSIVPMRTGDVLAFNAAIHPHGTTASTQTQRKRTTLNIRLWLQAPRQTGQELRTGLV